MGQRNRCKRDIGNSERCTKKVYNTIQYFNDPQTYKYGWLDSCSSGVPKKKEQYR